MKTARRTRVEIPPERKATRKESEDLRGRWGRALHCREKRAPFFSNAMDANTKQQAVGSNEKIRLSFSHLSMVIFYFVNILQSDMPNDNLKIVRGFAAAQCGKALPYRRFS